MCRSKNSSGLYRPFQQIAVTDWELCRFGRCKGYQAWEKDNLGKEDASSVPIIVQGEKDMEAYVRFLAGLAVGERDCLGENQRPDILIVREKQLTESQYIKLFVSLWETVSRCVRKAAQLIPHTYPEAASKTGSGWLHLPFSLYLAYQKRGMLSGLRLGVSIHSVEEAKEAWKLGAAYVTAGHIFCTESKKGMPPRGTVFLQQVCESVPIPVYAIGGIHQDNIAQIKETKAAGACLMSEYMRTRDLRHNIY